ncbi:MAG: helix-turn-helix domain-containing protein, partial [Desulfobacterales bacterium]
MDDAKRKSVLGWLQRIESSELSIAAFFNEFEVPFSRAQYFNYKRQIALTGPEGIQDRRKRGGNRKLSEEAEGFLLGCVKSNPEVTLEWLQQAIKENFICEVDLSTISRAIKRVS